MPKRCLCERSCSKIGVQEKSEHLVIVKIWSRGQKYVRCDLDYGYSVSQAPLNFNENKNLKCLKDASAKDLVPK
jgi:hypothetical protein